MMRPNVRHAFVMRLIDDAMRAAGFSEPTPIGHGAIVYWPARPRTESVRISVFPVQAETAPDLFALAQTVIDTALGPANVATP